jgi:hypothetical protein
MDFWRSRPVIGASPSGKAPDFDSGIPRFDPWRPSQALKNVTVITPGMNGRRLLRRPHQARFPSIPALLCHHPGSDTMDVIYH